VIDSDPIQTILNFAGAAVWLAILLNFASDIWSFDYDKYHSHRNHHTDRHSTD
jgi:hypothetical protein